MRRAIVVLTALLAAGCGSAGPSVGPSAQAPVSGPTMTSATQTGTITLSIPLLSKAASARARTPLYVSPNTTSIVITVVSVNGSGTLPPGVPSPATVALTTGASGNCTVSGTAETCVVPIPTPPGTVVYNLQLLSSSAAVLAENTVTLTIAAGSSGTNYAVQTLGLVTGVLVAAPALSAGTPFTGPLTITSMDASGATITGSATFFQAYTLTDNDTSGATYLTLNGGTQHFMSVTVTSPAEVVDLVYSGAAISAFTFTVSGASIPPGSPPSGTVAPQTSAIQFTGTYLDTAATGGIPSDVNWEQPTVFFSSIGQTESFSVSQSGQPTFSIALDPTTCGTSPTAVTLTTTDSVHFTAISNVTGICKATVTGSPGVMQTLWFSSTAASIGVN